TSGQKLRRPAALASAATGATDSRAMGALASFVCPPIVGNYGTSRRVGAAGRRCYAHRLSQPCNCTLILTKRRAIIRRLFGWGKTTRYGGTAFFTGDDPRGDLGDGHLVSTCSLGNPGPGRGSGARQG